MKNKINKEIETMRIEISRLVDNMNDRYYKRGFRFSVQKAIQWLSIPAITAFILACVKEILR